jgi:PAS domain S-box-containing protein
VSARKSSIRGRLNAIIMVTSLTAVLLTCAGFVTADLIGLSNEAIEQVTTLGRVIGANSVAALMFEDRQAARDVLNALREEPSIVAAGIYTAKGDRVACYAPNGRCSAPVAPRSDGVRSRRGVVELFLGIELHHARIGTLYIASDSRDLTERMKQYAAIAAGIVLVSMIAAFGLSARLQRGISQPIVELARVTRSVSQHKNYSLRATAKPQNASHEIDDMVDGFNGMLAEIERRDGALRLHQAHLEEQVAFRTRELSMILNSVSDGVLGINLDSAVTFCNPAAERMLGLAHRDFAGKTAHEVFHHSRADGSPWRADECGYDAVRGGQDLHIVDDTFWRPDGTSFPADVYARPMVDEDQRMSGVVVTFRDITEQRAIERLKSEFVSTVSHELRTPLTSIRGALGLLNSGLLGNVAEKGQRMLSIALNNTDRLVRLINDILDLERIDSGRIEVARAAVDAHHVMVQAAEGLLSIADQAGVRIVVGPATATLLGDSDRIIQTLTNLVGNAIKFSPRGTTVTLSGAVVDAATFRFVVEDEGRGVPEGALETIFERFKQVDASDSRAKGGSGLGLAISRSIVHAHGGRIWAERNAPTGMRFQFTIPQVPVATLAEDAAAGAPVILIVEDDLDLAGVMSAVVQARGFHALHARNGREAIDLSRQMTPALVVLDLALPDLDGFAVADAFRQTAALRHLPLLVYSAAEVGSADQSRLRLGRTEFLTKCRGTLHDFEALVVQLFESTRKKEDDDAA